MDLSVARISSNGQVSIPAEVRRRWGATEVIVIDKGDRVIVRPVPKDPVSALRGKYAATKRTSEDERNEERASERARARNGR
jgi:AbrB family looped-hinge helix DNA binding protein